MRRVCLALVLSLGLVVGLAPVSSVDAAVEACPDYLSVVDSPAQQLPRASGFRRFGNRLLSRWFEPLHMVHDQTVALGETATMVGKFDYDPVFHKDLEGEDIDVYIQGTGLFGWVYLGRFRTNSDGKIYVPIQAPAGEYEVRMVAIGDNSRASGYLSVIDGVRDAVVFDIDGTLTLSDFEQVRDWIGIDGARAHAGAIDVVNAYVDKGYQVFFLTARPYFKASLTRDWLASQGALNFWMRTTMDFTLPGGPTEAYKTTFLRELQDAGVNIVRVYGNADTDIAAYENVGIDKSETYIIGENAGMAGTQNVGADHRQHLATVVAATAPVNCQPR